MEPEDQEIDTRICSFTSTNGDEVVIDEFQDCVSAYYFHQDEMTGGVWLFNVGNPTGVVYEHPPFPPGPEYTVPHLIEGPLRGPDFNCLFHPADQIALITYKDQPIGLIWNGAHPGKSAYAAKDFGGALVMEMGPE
jgi:hypothetical protein